jgi:deazaflavin-dependent oxidoreductase (nitroreductase family)
MSDFNTQLIEEFRANSGQIGGRFEGRHLIVITVTGAKTGMPRTVPLVYAPDGDNYLIFASYAGNDAHPAWYHNIVAHPRLQAEVGDDTFPVDARVLEGDERQRGFELLAEANPAFRDYQQKTSRVIPVIELTRVS